MSVRIPTVSQHDQLVRALADTFDSQGYHVRADHISHPNGAPGSIGEHVPDIKAWNDSQIVIAEAETSDTISTNETHTQWTAFSNATKRANAYFHIIVPKDSLESAKAQASNWGIHVDQWWYI